MRTPFSFQIEYKQTGCEDAPPVASVDYSIVCDGLGGSGMQKYDVPSEEGTEPLQRTGAYIGSRVVSDCVTEYFDDNPFSADFPINNSVLLKELQDYTEGLKKKIIEAMNQKKTELGAEPHPAKSMKLFPTTLSAITYFNGENALYNACIWAGDSRIYVLSPTKGLQQLSKDDADESEDSMMSGTVMNNCLSADNEFHLNYLIYKVTEPCIIFACSDGVFDYVRSPLNLEWALLTTILNLKDDLNNNEIADAMANAFKTQVFETIASDDTTMCGILYKIENISQLKEMYQERMNSFGSVAVEMNKNIASSKNLRTERDKIRKAIRIGQQELRSSLKNEILRLFVKDEQETLSGWIRNLEIYKPYQEKEEQTRQYYKQLAEEQESRLEKNEKGQECWNLLKLDYLRYLKEHDTQSRTAARDVEFSNNSKATTVLETVYNMLSMDDFLDYLKELYDDNESETMIAYGRKITKLLKETIPVMDTKMSEFYRHAFYSRSRFRNELAEFDNDASFKEFAHRAFRLKDKDVLKFLSSRTIEKYNEYNRLKKSIVQKKPARNSLNMEEKQELSNIRQAFIDELSDEVVDEVMKLSADDAIKKLLLKGIGQKQLDQYQADDASLAKAEADLAQAEANISEIWTDYRVNYELFKQIDMGGNV